MTEFYDQIFYENDGRYSVIVEDDGRVAYAYLLRGEDTIGDVWLYNQDDTPLDVNWSNPEDIPFLNPREFVAKEISPIVNTKDLKLKWESNPEVSVTVYVKDRSVAKLTVGSKPGWSALVSKDGPLARLMD